MVLNYITQFSVNNPMIFLFIIIAASLVLLFKAADFLVYGLTRYAHKLGISDYLIGLIIVSLGASLPELVSSIMGTLADETGIIFGTILGSTIAGFGLVLGLLAVMGKEIDIKVRILEKTRYVVFILGILPFFFILNGVLSRIEGIILIAAWFGYNFYLWRKEGAMGKIKKDVKLEKIWRDAIIAIIALVVITLSGRWLVFSSMKVSSMFGITPYVVAVIVIGIGTQIPDLAVGIRALAKGHQDIAFADVLGSTLVKMLLFLGIFALIKPLTIDPRILISAMILFTLSLGLVLYFTKDRKLTRKEGIILLILYAVFIASVLVF